MILAGHGIEIVLPAGWSGRIFRRPQGNAVVHAGDFRLALGDGEFGDASTGDMPAGATFLALVEYVPGAGLRAGRGLYAARSVPRPLDPRSFSAQRLAHPRPEQVGTQHFFTAAGRPLCLYVVLAGGGRGRRRQLSRLDVVLAGLRVAPAGGGAAATPV